MNSLFVISCSASSSFDLMVHRGPLRCVFFPLSSVPEVCNNPSCDCSREGNHYSPVVSSQGNAGHTLLPPLPPPFSLSLSLSLSLSPIFRTNCDALSLTKLKNVIDMQIVWQHWNYEKLIKIWEADRNEACHWNYPSYTYIYIYIYVHYAYIEPRQGNIAKWWTQELMCKQHHRQIKHLVAYLKKKFSFQNISLKIRIKR